MLQNAERIFFIFVNPVISLVVIALNSTVIYKIVKLNKRSGQNAKYMETNNASLPTKETVQSGSCEIHESKFGENEKSQGTLKEQFKKKKEETQQKIPIQKKNISKYMILLLNLAISDLLIGVAIIIYVFLMFIQIHIESETLLFVMGFLISCLLPTSLLVSLANLQLAAILKFYAILRPFKYRSIKNRFIVKICLIQWILVTLPVTMDYAFTYSKLKRLHSKFYQVIIPPLIFTAITALAITYFLIFRSIQNRAAVGKSHNVSHNKQREKALKTCLYTVISFTMFWLPTSGWGIYEICTENRNQPIGKVLSYFVLLNPVVNPLIYIVVFRKQT